MRLPRVVAVMGIVGLLGAAGALSACAPEADPEATVALPTEAFDQACAAAVDEIVQAVADLVAGYEVQTSTTGPAASPSPEATPGAADEDPLATAVADARRTRDRLGCDPEAFADDLRAGLGALEPDGAIAGAVARRASASILGTIRQEAGEWQLARGESLVSALAEAAEGTTIILPAGTIELDETAVVLEGVTLRGAGSDETVIRSTASDAAVIVATAGVVGFEDLTIERTGSAAGSGIVAGPSASIILTGVRVAGAVADGAGAGGAGLYLAGQGDEGSGRGTTLEVTDAVFERNDWAGVAVTGGHRVSIESSTFARNGEIGILFLDASDGSVADSVFLDNGVGIAVSGDASPALVGGRVSGGSVGVQADGSATPTIQGLRISGAERGAVIFGATSAGSVSDTVCVDVPYGIVVADGAAPTLEDNDCEVVRGAG